MGKEYTYNIGKYTIGVDTNGEDGIGLTVAIIENDKINFLGSCYGENARCIDLLIRENQELKKQIEEKETQFIEYLESEKDRLAQGCSHAYEDNLGKILYVNEDIYNEVNKILSKYKEIIGGKE